ncbi:MAG: Hsp70 family protein [Paracoccaceae bacterium]
MGDISTSATLGVDFGTSNSAVGILLEGKPHIIELEPGNGTIPTSVFFDFPKAEMLIGTPANRALIQGREGRFMRSLKSVLGTPLMREKRYLMGQELTFVDIIARFLHAAKTRAEATTGQRFDRALSGRPVHFHSSDATRDEQALVDLRECYLTAGFDDVAFMFEPEAAALANGALADVGDIGLIVDIGGGTSDFSLFERADQGINIIASHGVRVGGTDFDKSISVDHVMPHFGKGSLIGREMGAGEFTAPNGIFNDLATWQMIPFLYAGDSKHMVAQLRQLAKQPELFARLAEVLDMELGHDIAFAVERGKIAANRDAAGSALVDLAVVEAGLQVPLSHGDMAGSLAGHVGKIQACALETLALAGCPVARVKKVIFVGGSSLMTAVEQAMCTVFPDAELEYSDAFTAIVDGLAIASARP